MAKGPVLLQGGVWRVSGRIDCIAVSAWYLLAADSSASALRWTLQLQLGWPRDQAYDDDPSAVITHHPGSRYTHWHKLWIWIVRLGDEYFHTRVEE